MTSTSNNGFNLSQRLVLVFAVATLGKNHAKSASQVKPMLDGPFGQKIMKEILYTTALDTNHHLIRIENATKGTAYFCPLCMKEMIYRNSGKTGKGSRRPHFAHYEISANCTAESVLHYSFKYFLVEFLQNKLNNNSSLTMSWFCEKEKHINEVNLLGNVSSIKMEYNLKECRPDIALFDNEEKLIAVIEVIVTHYPNENTVNFYKENDIVLIEVILSSEDDLNNIESKIKNPNYVDYCLYPKCNNYIEAITSRRLYIYNDICKSLYHHQLKKCYVEIKSVFGVQKTLALTEEEIRLSKGNGVEINLIKRKDNQEEVIEFPCKKCAFERSKYRRNRIF